MDNRNEIFFDPTQGFFGANSNYEKTRRVGVEVGQETNIHKLIQIHSLDKLRWVTNYTYQNPRFNEGTNDKKQIPLVPHHQISNSLVTEFWKNYQLSLTDNYVSSQFAINDTANATPLLKPYMTVDSKLTYRNKNFEIYGAVNNIFNQYYSSLATKSTSSTAKSFFPSPTRNFTIGVNYKF